MLKKKIRWGLFEKKLIFLWRINAINMVQKIIPKNPLLVAIKAFKLKLYILERVLQTSGQMKKRRNSTGKSGWKNWSVKRKRPSSAKSSKNTNWLRKRPPRKKNAVSTWSKCELKKNESASRKKQLTRPSSRKRTNWALAGVINMNHIIWY